MKISPIMPGAQAPAQGQIQNERTSPDRLAQAKAVAQGMTITESDTPVDPQVRKAQDSIRRLKMRTQVSPDRNFSDITNDESDITPESAISEENEGVEETKPLSPQFAQLAKQRRALQVKERELEARELALKSQPTESGGEDLTSLLKSQPLRVLQDQGILTPEFYNSLTEFLVSGQSGINPEIQSLKDEIKALKEGVDKTFVDRDTQAEQQVLSEMKREAEYLAKEGDDFELVRETQSVSKVVDLIHRNYKETGEVLDVKEAMQLIEDQLLEDSLKFAQFKKVQSRFQPPEPQPLQPQQRPLMRTLTNRDSAPQPMDRRTRAMMAALGQLK